MRATLALILALVSPPPVSSWVPRFDTTYVRVEVGETRSISVRATPIGSPNTSWARNWIFRSTDPNVATVAGTMTGPAPIDIAITGIAPAMAGLYIEGVSNERTWVTIDVQCGAEELLNATPDVKTIIGRAATLRVETPYPDRTAFTWYRGRNGDTSQPVANAGPELTLMPEARGVEHYWVLVTTPCSQKSAEFRLETILPKQRSARR